MVINDADLEPNDNFIHNKYGYCFYSLESNGSYLIYNLYVESEFRRQGHATRLLNLVIQEIRNTGYNNYIFIEVEPRENSISMSDLTSFYNHMGLTILIR